MKRLAGWAALAGFLIAIIVGSAAWYINVHDVPESSLFFHAVVFLHLLWPTSILNGPDGLGTACDFGACSILLAFSAIANAGIYALLGTAFGFFRRKIATARAAKKETQH